MCTQVIITVDNSFLLRKVDTDESCRGEQLSAGKSFKARLEKARVAMDNLMMGARPDEAPANAQRNHDQVSLVKVMALRGSTQVLAV